MKRLWIGDLICAIIAVLCGTLFLVKTLCGNYDPAWAGWFMAACEYVGAGLFGVSSYMAYRRFNK